MKTLMFYFGNSYISTADRPALHQCMITHIMMFLSITLQHYLGCRLALHTVHLPFDLPSFLPPKAHGHSHGKIMWSISENVPPLESAVSGASVTAFLRWSSLQTRAGQLIKNLSKPTSRTDSRYNLAHVN